ncbi:MAG: hypothetical protein M3Z05_04020 [Gemmatimonadota bacterium]|nr:hypothetical protein [Gemmatimonadota bacterium]
MRSRQRIRTVLTGIVGLGALLFVARHGRAQAHDHVQEASANGDLHMEMTPTRRSTPADSTRATGVAAQLRAALASYSDTTAAVRDGYRMFMPQVKTQKIYHFTNRWNAVKEAFRFDPAKPTSLLYHKGGDGRFSLVGAMYTAPKRFGTDKLDARVPTSIARWHKHVNWCIPPKSESARWLERRNGEAVFGPESPIATKAACDAVGGVFHDTLFGWMLHANVMAGDDPKAVWGDDHAGHDMHEGMKMGGEPR